MASVQPVFGVEQGRGLRISYTAAEALTGGQLVERRTGNRLVGVAGAASNRVCGVAEFDVPAVRATAQGPQVGDGNEAGVTRMCVVPVTFTGAAAAGDKLVAGAAGAVTPAGATPDARQVVGEAFEDVGGAGTGLALIY